MVRNVRIPIDEGIVHVLFTDRSDGNFRFDLPPDDLASRRAKLNPHQWNWLHQTHSVDSYVVSEAGERQGEEGDALLTGAPDCPISVTTADCAPVVLVAQRGVAVIHAGWRGVLGGILEGTAEQLRLIGGEPIAALLGPCIHPESYEFGSDDLASLSAIYGPKVERRTNSGSRALDMGAAIDQALYRCGWIGSGSKRTLDLSNNSCTSGEGWFSHRSRGDTGRQATLAWIDA